MERQEILLCDMSRCQPAAALSAEPQHGCWQMVPYTADELSGTMVMARPETAAPEIRLALNARGWYAIYLATLGKTWAGDSMLRVKLSGDPSYVLAQSEGDDRRLEDAFWKVADLTGQELVIAQNTTAETPAANLAYVRLVPLTEEEVCAYKDHSQTKRLFAFNDGWSFYAAYESCSAQEIIKEIEPYRDTDFGRLSWEVWDGDKSNYPAKVGIPFGQGKQEFVLPGSRRVAERLRDLLDRGVDPLQVALDYAHGIDLELYAAIRMGGFGTCPPSDCFESPFFPAHPEYRCRDYDGEEISHLSYTFPQVRSYVLSLLADVSRYDVDGMNLIFHRGHPYVLYEEPLVKGFQQETGIDPRTLAEQDDVWRWWDRVVPTIRYDWMGRKWLMDTLGKQHWGAQLDELSESVRQWLRWRGRPMTEFMRGLRGVLESRGKGQKIAAAIFGSEVSNLYYGLDIEAWVKEGLIDIVIPLPWPEWMCAEVGFFRRIAEGKSVQVYPNLLPRQMEPREYLEMSIRYYAMGADGMAFWDANARHPLLSQWRLVGELGHKDDLGEWLKDGRFQKRFLQLKRLGEYTVHRHHPETAG